MKFQIDAGLLVDMVSTVAQAITAKPVNSECECAYIRVTDESGSSIMSVMARDSGLAIAKSTDKITAIEDGEALIPAKTLLAYAKLMNGDVTVSVDDKQKCTMKCGAKKTSIVGMDADMFQSDFSAVPDARTAKMDGDAFEKAVSSVLHCVSTNMDRMILTGVNFAFDAERGYCEATCLNGFQLAIARESAETNDTFNVTIPANYAKLIAKIIRDGKEVSFRFGAGMVVVEDYDTSIEAALLAGEYMDVKRLAFRDSKMQARVNASDLLDAVRTAMIAADNGKSLILLNFESEGTLRVTANSTLSEAVSSVSCETNGEMQNGAKEIAFNGKYVEEALRVSLEYAGEVSLLLNTPSSPMAILPIDRDDYYQLALPVRRMNG